MIKIIKIIKIINFEKFNSFYNKTNAFQMKIFPFVKRMVGLKFLI